jgi:hypothetical protein
MLVNIWYTGYGTRRLLFPQNHKNTRFISRFTLMQKYNFLGTFQIVANPAYRSCHCSLFIAPSFRAERSGVEEVAACCDSCFARSGSPVRGGMLVDARRNILHIARRTSVLLCTGIAPRERQGWRGNLKDTHFFSTFANINPYN